jgi:CRISPR/Cas system CSM-associated protein Csm4 (group 5 of RAMP superfamily)
MKKLLLPFIAITAVVTVVLVAQNNKQQTKTADAIEQAQFEAWKAANEKTAVAKKSAARSVNYQSPKMVSETQNTAKAKKGWSKAAKGAVIGGAGGAIAGAVINKRNRAAGAVIGGVIGAGGGYVIGRGMDKKDGRIQLN